MWHVKAHLQISQILNLKIIFYFIFLLFLSLYARAPEINEKDTLVSGAFKRDGNYQGPPSDVFSIGVALFIIIIGNYPFKLAWETCKYYKCIIDHEYSRFWAFHGNPPCSDAFKDLFLRMVEFDVSRRITLQESKEHEWFRGPRASMEEIQYFINSKFGMVNEGLRKEKSDKRRKSIFQKIKTYLIPNLKFLFIKERNNPFIGHRGFRSKVEGEEVVFFFFIEIRCSFNK